MTSFGLTPTPEAARQRPIEPDDKTSELGNETSTGVTFSLPSSPEAEAVGTLEPAGETADAIFEVGPDDAAHASSEPNGEDVDALIQALTGSAEPPKPTLKERVLQEVKKFAGIFIYLWVVFIVLLLHEWIVLSQNHIGFKFYGLAAINALLLGKIMLVAEQFRFAENLKRKPLIYPIVYKAVAFTTLLFIAYIIEEMVVGWIGGHGFFASVPRVGGSIGGGIAVWLIFCVALIPFFAFKEFQRAVGTDMIRKLLFG